MRPTYYEVMEAEYASMRVNFDQRFRALRDRIKVPPFIKKHEMLRLDPIAKDIVNHGQEYIPNFQPSLSLETEQTLFNFWSAGKKVFNVSPNLTHLLLNTDLKVQKRFLKLPFRCFLTRFENAPVELECADGSRARLDGCFVTEMSDSADSEKHTTKEQRIEVWNDVMAGREPNPAYIHEKHVIKFLFYSEIIEFKGRKVGNSAANWFELEGLAEDFVISDVFFEKREREMIADACNDYSLITRLAMNAVLYINSLGADLAPVVAKGNRLVERAGRQTNENQRQRFLDEARNHTRIDYIDVGRNVKLPKNCGSAAPNRTGKTWTVSFRFMVRAHWHSFWKLRKNLAEEERPFVIAEEGDSVLFRKFIEPYEKGRDLVEAVGKEYRVEE